MAKKPRIALVVGSGSVKCAAALGLWKALDHEGIPIDMLVGCSGGSIYASTMSLGFSLDECIEYTQTLWNERVTNEKNWRAMLSAVFPKIFKFGHDFGMISDRQMMKASRSPYQAGRSWMPSVPALRSHSFGAHIGLVTESLSMVLPQTPCLWILP
ncbi:MAG: patatin-like phospholipase family protein [Chloroflexi bacterium]|nr:patatin-like phospholipase family protein [Chloroflexota bacterium]